MNIKRIESTYRKGKRISKKVEKRVTRKTPQAYMNMLVKALDMATFNINYLVSTKGVKYKYYINNLRVVVHYKYL